MKHRIKHNQLGRNHNQNKALRRILVASVLEKGRVETTHPKAKAVVGEIDHLLALAKTDSVHNRRQMSRILGSDKMLNHIFKDISPKTGKRNSGFTRIIKTGERFSDGTAMAFLELVDYQVETKVVAPAPAEEKAEKQVIEKPKTEKVKEQKVTKAKAQTTQKPKAIGHK